MSFLRPKISDLVPNELKYIGDLAAFKKAIKKWSPEKCPYRLCKIILEMSVLYKKEVDEEFFPFKKLVNTIVLAIYRGNDF